MRKSGQHQNRWPSPKETGPTSAIGDATEGASSEPAPGPGWHCAVRGPAQPDVSTDWAGKLRFHGDADQTVNPVNGDQVIAQATPAVKLETTVVHGKATGGVAYIRTIQSDGIGRMLEQWALRGGGHAWSGGSRAGSYTDARGPDASRDMVRFFLQHSTAA